MTNKIATDLRAFIDSSREENASAGLTSASAMDASKEDIETSDPETLRTMVKMATEHPFVYHKA